MRRRPRELRIDEKKDMVFLSDYKGVDKYQCSVPGLCAEEHSTTALTNSLLIEGLGVDRTIYFQTYEAMEDFKRMLTRLKEKVSARVRRRLSLGSGGGSIIDSEDKILVQLLGVEDLSSSKLDPFLIASSPVNSDNVFNETTFRKNTSDPIFTLSNNNTFLLEGADLQVSELCCCVCVSHTNTKFTHTLTRLHAAAGTTTNTLCKGCSRAWHQDRLL